MSYPDGTPGGLSFLCPRMPGMVSLKDRGRLNDEDNRNFP